MSQNRARIPHHLRRQAYRWTRPPKPAPETTARYETCADGRHVWVSRNDPPEPYERCLCGKHQFGSAHDA